MHFMELALWSEIIIPSFKSLGQFFNYRIKKAYNPYVENGHTDFLVMIVGLFCYIKGTSLSK